MVYSYTRSIDHSLCSVSIYLSISVRTYKTDLSADISQAVSLEKLVDQHQSQSAESTAETHHHTGLTLRGRGQEDRNLT